MRSSAGRRRRCTPRPALSAALLIVATLVVTHARSPVSGAPADVVDEEIEIVALVNSARTEQGLTPLTTDVRLFEAAEGHAQWMADNDTLSHEGADGSTARDRAADAGYGDGIIISIGETLAAGHSSAEHAVFGRACDSSCSTECIDERCNGWRQSPGHWSTLMSTSVRDIGVGYVVDDDPADPYVHWWAVSVAFSPAPPTPVTAPTDTPGATATATSAITGTATITPTATLTGTQVIPTATLTPTVSTPTTTASANPSATPTTTATRTPAVSPTLTASPSRTVSPTLTVSATVTPSGTVSPTATLTATATATVSATATAPTTTTATVTATATISATAALSPTATPSPTATDSPTATATQTPTATTTPRPSPSATRTATATPQPSPTPDPLQTGRRLLLPLLMRH